MESMKAVVGNIMKDAPPETEEIKELFRTDKERAVKEVIEASNAEVDEEGMRELPCEICHGKGFIDIYDPDRVWWKQEECKCMRSRRALRYVNGLGLLKDVQRCSFDSYVAYDGATEDMKEAAMQYLDEMRWLYLGGQSGSGKTHLAYAIFGKLVRRNMAPVWMRWIQESQDLKMMIGEPEYDREVKRYQECEVLIIDDFFNLPPTDADIRLARVILDHRYTNSLPTVFTSELTLGEIDAYDDAIAGRIAEMSIVYQIGGKNHNYRMRNYR